MSTIKPHRTRKFSEIFKTFEDLFDVTLSTWNTAPMELELKDDTKPVCLRSYPVQKMYEAMFRKE